jgi:hypothetical protein
MRGDAMTTRKHNQRRLAIFALALALILPAVHGQAQKYEALLGVWDAETEGAQYTFVFTFKLEDGELAGTFEGQSGEVEMQNLAFEDNRVTFTVEIDAGGQASRASSPWNTGKPPSRVPRGNKHTPFSAAGIPAAALPRNTRSQRTVFF